MIKTFLKAVFLFVVCLFFAPIGVDRLVETINYEATVEEETEDSGRLNNPNKFNREYHLIVNDTVHTFYNLTEYESKIRTVYDKFGIQLYFMEYTLDYDKRYDSINGTVKEVKEYLNSNDMDPYGLYYVVAEYDAPGYGDPDYDKNVHYWDTELSGYWFFGSEVESWWNTDVQIAFEKSAEAYEYRVNSYNNYSAFCDSLSEMEVEVGKLTIDNEEPDIYVTLVVFTLFTITPITLSIIIMYKDLRKHKARKEALELEKARAEEEEARRILNTPIKTLEQEYAEELKDKYIDN